MHQLEHDAFFAALRKGETPNDVDYMAYSTLVGHHGPRGRLHRGRN